MKDILNNSLSLATTHLKQHLDEVKSMGTIKGYNLSVRWEDSIHDLEDLHKHLKQVLIDLETIKYE